MTETLPKGDLFRLSKEVWESLTYEEIVATSKDMFEMGLFMPPSAVFSVEVPKESFMAFSGQKDLSDLNSQETYVANSIEKAVFYYQPLEDVLAHERFCIDIYVRLPSGRNYINKIRGAFIKDQEDSYMFMGLYVFIYASLIVILASRNIEKKQVTNDPRSRNHQQRTDSKNYTSTTTIKVGNVTEYIGNKSEGSGRTVKPHLRRGHIKSVRHGKGRTELRKVFIHPTFVNADKDWVAPTTKVYNVVSHGKAFGF